ncbi:class I SAM-dependent methyltransferase [Qipengyuania qiaonensis]|uniref:Class I SAM-dependent methyltransferase n=1 Tax=Qipengyuania qiaonensis TaxID=2867240 RepID=A0ABS7J1V0_9SPHN|nr:class I SAM-dependent methyltransferase [Qipengyuania qiaonensis]MBX7481315.1 class I SAM-dependent methyltransferase [Qipengyuania qiaonensis]
MASPAPPRIFSRRRRIAGLRRASVRQAQRDAARYLMDDMVEDILDRLEFIRMSPARVLVIGDWTGTLALSLRGAGSDVTELDMATLDEEQPIDAAPYDLVVSLSSVDRVNDLPGALLHMRNALAEDGMMIASFLGAGSLPNLRRAMLAAEPDRPAARMHPLVDNQAASALLQRALFKRQVVDGRSLNVSFASLDRLVSDLRDQGLGSALANAPAPLGKAAKKRADAAFLAGANDKGRVLENFEILTLTGWKD